MLLVAEQVRRAEPEVAVERPKMPLGLLAEKLRAFPTGGLRPRIATGRRDAECDSRLATTLH